MLVKLFVLFAIFLMAKSQYELLLRGLISVPKNIGSVDPQLSFDVRRKSGTFTIPANGFIQITFPSSFVTSNPAFCQLTSAAINGDYGCSFIATDVLRITPNIGTVTTLSTLNIMIFKGITYPSVLDPSGSIDLQIQDNAATKVWEADPGSLTITLTKATMQSCAIIDSTENEVGQLSTLTFQLQTTNNIPVGGRIEIDSGIWNSALDEEDSDRYHARSPPNCARVSGDIDATPTCALNSNGRIIMNPVVSTIDATGTIEFTIDNILTPLSTGPSSSFSLKTQNATGSVLEECSGMTFQVSEPGPLTNWNFFCETAEIVGATVDCWLNFENTNPIIHPGGFKITFPPEMTVSGISYVPTALPGYFKKNYFPIANSGNQLDLSTIGQDDVPEGRSIQIKITDIILPDSLNPTSSFTIQSISDGFTVDENQIDFTYKAKVGHPINVINVAAVYTTAGEETEYTFELELTSELSNTGGILLTFPPEYTLTGTCVISGYLANFDGTPSCTHDDGDKTILLENLFGTTLPAASTVEFTISGIVNPPTTEPLDDNLLIQTLKDTTLIQSVIDEDNGFPIDFITPGEISFGTFLITPTPSITSESPAVYTFEFVATNPVQDGDGIRISFPKDTIEFPFPSTTPMQITDIQNIHDGALISLDDTSSLTENYIIIEDAFEFDYPAGTTFEFNLEPFRNYMTTEPLSDFYIATVNSNGFEIDTSNSPKTVTLTTPHEFNSITITPDTLENGQSGNYEFEIYVKRAHYDGDIFTIEFPPELTVNFNDVTLGVLSVPGATINSAIPVGNGVQITMDIPGGDVSPGSRFIFIVDEVQNNIYSGAIGSFTITSTDSSSNERAQKVEVVSLNTIPATLLIPGTSVTPSDTILGNAGVTYEFELETRNAIDAGGYIRVDFPAEIVPPTGVITCSNMGGVPGISCTSISASSIRIDSGTGFSATPPLEFNIADVQNPSTQTSSSFVISTFNAAGDKLDERSKDLRFNADCDNPCETCLADRTTCLSCFTDVSSTLKYLEGTECKVSCDPGRTDILFVCQDCNSPCEECASGDLDECTACEVGTFLEGDECLLGCPATRYPEPATNTCEDCDTKCATCSYYDICVTCPVGKKKYGDDCLDDCPANVSIDTGTECEECNPTCSSCVDNVNKCLSCKSEYFLYDEKCIDECPVGLFYHLADNTCYACTHPCKSCQDTNTYCTSCEEDEGYAFGGVCSDTCPAGTYPEVNGVCEDCPTGCAKCTDSVTCTLCESSYYLYEESCVDPCPIGTVESGNTCKDCETGCSQCSGTTSNCQDCDVDYFLTGSSCVSNCPGGQYGDAGSGECEDCNDTCGSCDGPNSNDCTSCVDGDAPYLTPGQKCASVCPDSYYGDDGSNQCVPCHDGCLECDGPSNTQCSACETGFKQYQTSCLENCPADISIEVNNECVACASPCKTCSGSIHSCSSCVSEYNLVESSAQCVQECPDGMYALDGICTECSSPCLTCESSANNCVTCSGSLVQLNGECVTSCPSLTHYEDDGICIRKSAEETVGSIFSGDAFPLPFLISSLLALLFVVGSKAQAAQTVTSSNCLALLSFVELMSWIVFVILYSQKVGESDSLLGDNRMDFYFVLIGIVLNYAFNIAHTIIICKKIKSDVAFAKWSKESPKNKKVFNFVAILSGLTTFRLFRLAYARMLNKPYFSAKLSSNKDLRPIHILTVISLLTASLAAIIGSIIMLQKGLNSDQLTITGIEIPIVSFLVVIFSGFDANKPADFYDPEKSSKVTDIRKLSSKSNSKFSFNGKENENEVSPNKVKVRIPRDDPNKTNHELLDDQSSDFDNTSFPNLNNDTTSNILHQNNTTNNDHPQHEDIVLGYMANRGEEQYPGNFDELVNHQLFRKNKINKFENNDEDAYKEPTFGHNTLSSKGASERADYDTYNQNSNHHRNPSIKQVDRDNNNNDLGEMMPRTVLIGPSPQKKSSNGSADNLHQNSGKNIQNQSSQNFRKEEEESVAKKGDSIESDRNTKSHKTTIDDNNEEGVNGEQSPSKRQNLISQERSAERGSISSIKTPGKDSNLRNSDEDLTKSVSQKLSSNESKNDLIKDEENELNHNRMIYDRTADDDDLIRDLENSQNLPATQSKKSVLKSGSTLPPSQPEKSFISTENVLPQKDSETNKKKDDDMQFAKSQSIYGFSDPNENRQGNHNDHIKDRKGGEQIQQDPYNSNLYQIDDSMRHDAVSQLHDKSKYSRPKNDKNSIYSEGLYNEDDGALSSGQESIRSHDDKGNPFNEDTPSNYNKMNQRYDEEEIYAGSNNTYKKSQFGGKNSSSVHNTLLTSSHTNIPGVPHTQFEDGSKLPSNYSRLDMSIREQEANKVSRNNKFKSAKRGSTMTAYGLHSIENISNNLNKGGPFNDFGYSDYSDFKEIESMSPDGKRREPKSGMK